MVQIVRFVSNLLNLSNILVQNGQYPSYIDIIYRIVRLIGIVLGNGKGNSPISTHDTVKFIQFWTVNYGFRFETIYLQEFDLGFKLGSLDLQFDVPPIEP